MVWYTILSLSLLLLVQADSSLCSNLHQQNLIKRRALSDKSNDLTWQKIVEHLSPAQARMLLKQINHSESSSVDQTCENNFETLTSQIIRTKDSLRNGAQFLQALNGTDSSEKCRAKCCIYNKNSNTPHAPACDVAVFQLLPESDRPRCYLFSCYNRTTDTFSCLFSDNKDFITVSRKIVRRTDSNAEQLEDVVGENQHDKITATTVTTALNTLSSTIATTSLAKTVPIQNPESPHFSSAKESKEVCIESCHKFDWQCDNKCCIQAHDVCNGIPDCSDKSDETGCDHKHEEPSTNDETANAKSGHVEMNGDTNSNLSFEHLPMASDVKEDEKALDLDSLTVQTTALVKEIVIIEEENTEVDPEAGAVLPLAIGLAVTACVLLMVACRVRTMKKKLRTRGKPLFMDESDYLINGMYL